MTGVTRFCANFLSYLFHPLFISSYVMAFLIFVHPMAFSEFDHVTRVFRLITILSCNVFFPLFSVFVMWRLKLFVTSMYLRRKGTDRSLYHRDDLLLVDLESFLRTSPIPRRWPFVSWPAPSWRLSAPSLQYLFQDQHPYRCPRERPDVLFPLPFTDDYASGLYLSIVLAVTGLVATSRLLVGRHTRFEVWAGLFIGMLAQVVGWYGPFS